VSSIAQVIPPDNRAAGQTGHIQDHNNISDMLALFQATLGGLPAFQTGTASLTAGTVTVPNTSAVTGCLLFLSRVSASGTVGTLTWSIMSGTSFTIVSSSNTDTSTIAWMLVTPA
jgi:hypothetical protein